MFRSVCFFIITAIVTFGSARGSEPVNLYAAGSLKAALGDVATAFEQSTGQEVETAFGPSGMMRERIELGEPAHLFASANMAHPRKLHEAGKAGPVRLFARNKICAIARPGLDVNPDTLLAVMTREDVRLGTSTPKSDPSGDYAWELFARAEAVKPGSRKLLEEKALQLTGGPTSEKPPAGRNNYAWVMDSGKADVFLTYCTNAVLAQREVPQLQIISIPPDLSVGAKYGLTVMNGAPSAADSLAAFILGPEAREILAAYGFDPAAGE